MMRRIPLAALSVMLAFVFVISLARPGSAGEMKEEMKMKGKEMMESAGMMKAPPGGKFKKVSTLVKLPDFLSGIGTLYVDPATLPAGPFLAYDHAGNLVSTVYMIPVKDIDNQKAFKDLNVAHQRVDHVDMYYNAGHPGVPEPHYHIVLWYISPEKAAALK